ncbi:MAG: 50S ribosomal protein L11 methyltransferase [bacterium]|nr:50S ribosomal protein L11 methyltransferase [bacterium]
MSPPDHGTATTYRLHLVAPFELTSRLTDRLAQMDEINPPAISMHETADPLIWALDAYYQTRPDLIEIKSFLEAAISPLPSIELTQMENEDWVAIVQSGLSPIRAGRYFIYGSHDRARADQLAGDIEIDAGQAFGTAHHGTTKGCLLALDHLFKSHRYNNVLDLGTGTGLLAIAAAKILRRPVMASDIDPISVKISKENAALNMVGPLLRAIEANGLHHPALQNKAPYDLMIANILAQPLLQMAPDIKNNLRPRGHLILSGMLCTQSRAVEARYHGHGFNLVKRLQIDEWMTLILQKR